MPVAYQRPRNPPISHRKLELLSDGRGGWLGGIAGAAYLLYRRGLKARVLAGLAGAVISIAIAYQALPTFRRAVDLTIEPDPHYLASSVQIIPGLDDGDRLYIWGLEAAKFVSSPLLGTGFFHRGGASGLFSTGSHNFFLQIALETGAIGGLSMIMIFRRMWQHAGSYAARAAGQQVPLRSALIAAIVGAMSGEYFYGSAPLLCLFLLYAPVGALPCTDHKELRHEDLDRG